MSRKARTQPQTTDQATEAHLDAINVDENGRFVEDVSEREGRGEKKKRAWQLENLGEELINLKAGQLVRVPMPDDLAAAVHECRRILEKGGVRGGYRRQVQLVGKIMRTLDAEPIAKAIEALRLEGTKASEAFQLAERWRTRLLDGTDADIDAVCNEQPKLDRTQLRQTVRAAQKERAERLLNRDKPSTNQKKVFRLLREVFDPLSATNANVDDDANDDVDTDDVTDDVTDNDNDNDNETEE